jgi:hypothetical protein
MQNHFCRFYLKLFLTFRFYFSIIIKKSIRHWCFAYLIRVIRVQFSKKLLIKSKKYEKAIWLQTIKRDVANYSKIQAVERNYL